MMHDCFSDILPQFFIILLRKEEVGMIAMQEMSSAQVAPKNHG